MWYTENDQTVVTAGEPDLLRRNAAKGLERLMWWWIGGQYCVTNMVRDLKVRSRVQWLHRSLFVASLIIVMWIVGIH